MASVKGKMTSAGGRPLKGRAGVIKRPARSQTSKTSAPIAQHALTPLTINPGYKLRWADISSECLKLNYKNFMQTGTDIGWHIVIIAKQSESYFSYSPQPFQLKHYIFTVRPDCKFLDVNLWNLNRTGQTGL